METLKAHGEKPSKTSIAWSVASRTLPGEVESGDSCLVTSGSDRTLVAVVDGLGHGPEAAAAARTALAVLASPGAEPIVSLVQRCHDACRSTRGVAMSLALVSTRDDTVTWSGVGNIEGILLRADAKAHPPREWLLLRSGIVGYSLPTLEPSTLPITPGDMLIFATDGILSRFAEGLTLSESPQETADRILAQFGKRTDDALVLAARYAGRAP